MTASRPSEAVSPFVRRAADAELDDLRMRLRAARLPERETTRPDAHGWERWQQGPPRADVAALVEYWRTVYDWRSFERRLAEIGQFRTVIDGLGIHFLHRRSSRLDAVPLIMTHGWPGSVAEFVDVIDDLAEPNDPTMPAFHVVAPSLPGYGYSDKPDEPGWGTERIAAAWVQLMTRLGYGRFLAHGSDWGGPVTIVLAGRFPSHVIGMHTSTPQSPPGLSTDGLDATERRWVAETRAFDANRLAYAKVMATSPQTIGYALVDSPVGLLAWILEKFHEWTDTVDTPFESISRDRLLDNVTLYWLTGTGASAARIYFESHQSLDPDLRVDVPAALTTYPHDIEKHPRPWAAQRFRNIVRWRAAERGGHFPSLEMPEAFVADLREGLAAVLAEAGDQDAAVADGERTFRIR
ncbi:pimeloyl-ACP methyl ester carboxylesterase [Microbacterium paludicola]|uniref:Pimeloyl-ACP methyl ester carboxylesterase n=1 Tax=Microbacterium paludicola TaxID=300019 RepID=A0ABU1HYS3_9MICO|nr:epoxide hydrolase [Microbacterium paludicola]MDR6166799.1 pimeloyl-ACP methyl ester carboxylesterase [Microbacterium paludicola]